jgi:hypothetical protein
MPSRARPRENIALSSGLAEPVPAFLTAMPRGAVVYPVYPWFPPEFARIR